MKRYTSGQEATYGLYVSASPPDICFVGADGETLDGEPGRTYRRLPMAFVVLLGPVAGGLFVFAFPVLVIGALLYAAWTALGEAFTERGAALTRVQWEPAAAYFKKGADSGEAAPETDPELAELEAEVQARAEHEKRGS